MRLTRLVTIGIAALTFLACGQPSPTPQVTTLPTESPPGVDFEVQGKAMDPCGAIGFPYCRYFAELAGPDSTVTAEFAPGLGGGAIGVPKGVGFPAALPLGDYALTAFSRVAPAQPSDVPQLGREDARCVTDFSLTAGQRPIVIIVTFEVGACSFEVRSR